MILRTSGAVYPATEHNIQEDLNLQHHRWQKFKSRKNISTPLTLLFEICTLLPLTLMLGASKSNFGLYSDVILNTLKYTAKLYSP